MKTTVQISGSSDDLIEIEGTVPGCDEYGHYDRGQAFIEFSTGDVLTIQYSERGVWEIGQHVAKSLSVEIVKAPPGDDPEPYTDTATVKGDIEYVDVWTSWPPTDGDLIEKVNKKIEDGIDLEDARLLRRVFAALYPGRKWL